MKQLLAALGLLVAANTVVAADSMYWVVGNHATSSCDIVTSNPVVIGDIWFEDGPYRSLADAKLARSTINACPKIEEANEPPAQ